MLYILTRYFHGTLTDNVVFILIVNTFTTTVMLGEVAEVEFKVNRNRFWNLDGGLFLPKMWKDPTEEKEGEEENVLPAL